MSNCSDISIHKDEPTRPRMNPALPRASVCIFTYKLATFSG